MTKPKYQDPRWDNDGAMWFAAAAIGAALAVIVWLVGKLIRGL